MRLSKQSALWSGRVLVWFSCGAASACAAKLACERYGDELEVLYCDTSRNEHPDNQRFKADVEKWIGRKIKVLKSEKYSTVEEVFAASGFMSSTFGAKCTTEMKKIPRFKYQDAADVHIFGYTLDEAKRITDFEKNNPELNLEWILRDQGITKDRCYEMLIEARIELPMMYKLGFEHNNCVGCVKSQSPGYWNKTRKWFPEVFDIRARQSREIGCKLVKLHGVRIFLDELPADAGLGEPDGEIECGPQCQTPKERSHA